MELKKLAPWNWFKKEQEQEGRTLPVLHQESPVLGANPILQIHQEIDRLFDRALRGFGFPLPGTGRELPPMTQTQWLKPTLDVGATEAEYTITVELPGVDQEDVRLELDGDTLRITGQKRQEKEEKRKDYYRVERSYGSFQRVLSLPEDADDEGINAVYKNGVMKISIPRKALSKTEAKQIEIKRG